MENNCSIVISGYNLICIKPTILMFKEARLLNISIWSFYTFIFTWLSCLFAVVRIILFLFNLLFWNQKVSNVSFAISFFHFTYFVINFGGKFNLMFVSYVKIKSRETQINFFTFTEINLFGFFKSLVFVFGL